MRLRSTSLQSDVFAKVVDVISRKPAGLRLLRLFRESENTRPIYNALIGYCRPFASPAHADAAIAAVRNGGHESPVNVDSHLELGAAARPSDYAAFYHLQPRLPEIRRVYDVGGNVGNLFYCYQRYLTWRTDLEWTVNDLPLNMQRGAALAIERGADQLSFSAEWQDASGADLLIASGALHYFGEPLPTMVRDLIVKPRFILVNRTPMTGGPQIATVQDTGRIRVSCTIYNRSDFIETLLQAGYKIVDEWQSTELSLRIPGHPEHSGLVYSGMFFSRR